MKKITRLLIIMSMSFVCFVSVGIQNVSAANQSPVAASSVTDPLDFYLDTATPYLRNAYLYTNASINTLTKAINGGIDLKRNPNATAAQVDAQINLIINAVGNLVPIEKEELYNLIQTAKNINKNIYIQHSYDNLNWTISYAEGIYNNRNATAAMIADGVSQLRYTMDHDMVLKGDTSSLDWYINSATPYLRNGYLYTRASIDNLGKVMNAAFDLKNDPNLTEEQVIAQNTLIINAVGNLVPIEKEALYNLIQSAKSITPEKYTPGTYAILQSGISDAMEVYKNSNASTEQINTAVNSLQDTIDHYLHLKADKTALNKAITKAKNYVKQAALYTTESMDNLKVVLNQALAFDDDVWQEQVDAQVTLINNAIVNLEFLED